MGRFSLGLREKLSLDSDRSSSSCSYRQVFTVAGIAMAFLSLTALFVTLATIYGSTEAGPTARLEGFSLDDVLSGRFYGESFNGTWISDKEFTYRTAYGGINNFNVATGVKTVILTPEIALQLRVASYKFSPDRNYILYSFDGKSIYRYSSLSRYSIIDLANNIVYPLQPQQLRTRGLEDPQLYLRYATWNKEDNSLIYVYENDIYFRGVPNASTDVRLTKDGERDTVFNGVPDWVYEEEVLSSDNAMWLSKNGQRLVFAAFDDRNVDVFDYPLYGEPSSIQYQYPLSATIRYPKAGRTNPICTLNVIDLRSETFAAVVIAPPVDVSSQDHYFTTVAWANEDEVLISWLNRHQNVSHLSFCNVSSSTCQTERTVVEPSGWVDIYSPPKFSSDGQQYLMILPVSQGEVGNFKHLTLIDRPTNQLKPLTQGRWEVTEIIGWDEVNSIAYIVGTAIDKPASRHLYKVSTASATPDFTCVTCGTLNADGKECTYNNLEFSTDLGYYVHGCDGPNIPRAVIKETTTNREVFFVTDNADLRERLSQKALPRPLNMQVPLEGNYMAQVRLILPPSLNRNKASQYPLLVYVYGGPHSQQVSDRYRIDWGTHLASSRGVIYALIDGRGSGYQGDKMLHEIYRRMGTVEVEDQIKVAKFLIENLPFVDGNRTAIWGWSYGGFAAASTLAKDTENVFKCAMSVAPVTNWIYYDSIYTERYMGLPTPGDNEIGYVESDVCRMAENFRNKKFYLVHGTADDNVHYQQAMMLSRALEAADVLFRQQSYPDENHSIAHLKKHLYHSLGAFLMTDCFELENEVWG